MSESLSRIEETVAAGGVLTRADAAAVIASHDLIRVGLLGEAARHRRAGRDVTFGRVAVVPVGQPVAGLARAGEVRVVGRPASIEDACARVAAVADQAGSVPLTGFSAADLLELAGHDHLALAEVSARLHAAGLFGIAECPLDRIGSPETAADVIRAFRQGGLQVLRLTVDAAAAADRLDLIVMAHTLQQQVGGVCAFAPLPRRDPVEAPSTGFDDVRTVAVAALACPGIPFIQVDWPLYGPKLAQVAIAYGANDVDGVAALDTDALGARRSASEDILRQIRAAGGVPVERDGRYERRP